MLGVLNCPNDHMHSSVVLTTLGSVWGFRMGGEDVKRKEWRVLGGRALGCLFLFIIQNPPNLGKLKIY